MSTTEWHVPDDELRRYADRESTPPLIWSTEAHLAACARCRQRLAVAVGPELVRAGWSRLDTELDVPDPGPVERLVMWLGVADHTARLLAATPALRRSWLVAVASTLVLTATLANLVHPVVFLAVVPLLPLMGVAASFGPGVDPTYEIALVAPMHTFRLLLLRTSAVLATTTALSAVTTLALPRDGLAALGWFLPALVLTLTSLVLAAQLGPVLAAGSVGLGWIALVTTTLRSGASGSIVFAPVGQLGLAVAGMLAAVTLAMLRPAFETPHHTTRIPRIGSRRIP
jgi:hypothetical protein